MSYKVTVTTTVTNPDTGWQQQTKIVIPQVYLQPGEIAESIADHARRMDHPRLELDDDAAELQQEVDALNPA